ncbi:SDR family NAD(P)-dependent oxidoreductase [Arhodomonas sp. AD133]|uniref:SDR family NAD(P)-dependent oxidoreductase n=1 Tax=Arhodomonas sp. AD133 TaxID=3415009 RepID=UPI003EBA6584
MKQVVVVGGSGGIGAAIAAAFADSGHAVYATGVEKADGSVVDGIRYDVLDVRDGEAVKAYFDRFDELHALVNCAGVIRRGEEFEPEAFADVVDINLNGMQRCCAAAYPALRRAGGSVINIASMLTFFGSPAAPAYAASKGGVGQLTKSLAVAWAPEGVRVNALAPGWIATDLTSPLVEDAQRSSELVGRTPMGRWGEPADLGGPALFLASEQARFVTGAILPVDGGYAAR